MSRTAHFDRIRLRVFAQGLSAAESLTVAARGQCRDLASALCGVLGSAATMPRNLSFPSRGVLLHRPRKELAGERGELLLRTL